MGLTETSNHVISGDGWDLPPKAYIPRGVNELSQLQGSCAGLTQLWGFLAEPPVRCKVGLGVGARGASGGRSGWPQGWQLLRCLVFSPPAGFPLHEPRVAGPE